MFLYEIIGNENYILDSVNVTPQGFSFNTRHFPTGVYRLSYNNQTNSLDFIINSNESKNTIVKIQSKTMYHTS
jgi:hypothetical protein